MPPSLIGAFQPGNSLLHRLPPGAKLAGLAALSVATVILASVPTTSVVLALAVASLALARVRIGLVLRTLRGVLVVMTVVAAYQTWQRGWEHAFMLVGGLISLLLLATTLTVTTSVDAMLDTVARALSPLRRFGVDPELVSLAFSLMMRGIPTTLQVAAETRQAALARGLERSPRAYLTPLVIRMVAHARATGEALHARGIGDDRDETPVPTTPNQAPR